MIELCDADITGLSIAKIADLRAPNNIEVSASSRCEHNNFDLVVSTCRPRVSISDTPRVLSETIGVVADG